MNTFLSSKYIKIGLHILFWVLFFFIPLGFAGDMNIDFARTIEHSLQRTFFFALLFYPNYFWLIDAFLNRKKWWVFLLVNLIVIIGFLYLKEEFKLFEPGTPPYQNPGPKPGKDNFIFYIDFLIFLIPVAVAIALKSFRKLSQIQLQQAQDEKNLLQQELQYLKYQIQPHFFFNSLNNIYSLIDLDKEKAKDSVYSLSKMMRYMLYRTDNSQVVLKEEINFLSQYIDLMQLRMRKNTYIQVDFPTEIPTVKIAPLLFISLVENSFKHGVSATEPSELIFRLNMIENQIIFTSENTNFPKTEDDESGSGIGIDNLKKRLILLYPNKHSFSSHVKDNRYYSELKIEI